jgi:DNA-binding PadR family transcriptional regulator
MDMNLNDIFAEEEASSLAETRAEIERERAFYATPEGQRHLAEVQAERERKQQALHEKGMRLGWWDEDGNTIEADVEDGEDEEDDDTCTASQP